MFVADGGLADTIVARATAAGPSARAIVRISGAAALELASTVFHPDVRRFTRLAIVRGAIVLGDVRVGASAVAFLGPRSFTGEDLVELHLPSAEPLVERLVDALGRAGARPARPGEFTRRAFLAGRLDLTAAEAVLALCESATAAEARLAARRLRGDLAREVERVRAGLLDCLAELEAALDFAHEDIESDLLDRAGFGTALSKHREDLAAFLACDASRESTSRVPVVALFGPANAGKSSLLNALADSECAIVSAAPGTTRDPVMVRLAPCGVPADLVDLAGVVTESRDHEGFGRAPASPGSLDAAASRTGRNMAAAADLVIVVLDGSLPLSPGVRAALDETEGRDRLIVRQKADLPVQLEITEPSIAVSARARTGLDGLGAAIATRLSRRPQEEASGVGPNARHRACLERAQVSVEAALTAYGASIPHDLVAVDLRAALDALGEVTGAACAEDVLDRIFARFCIGK